MDALFIIASRTSFSEHRHLSMVTRLTAWKRLASNGLANGNGLKQVERHTRYTDKVVRGRTAARELHYRTFLPHQSKRIKLILANNTMLLIY